MNLQDALRTVYGGKRLSREQAREVFTGALSEDADPAVLGAFLITLAKRRETTDEILGAAEALRAAMVPFEHPFSDAIDTCGTGGDGLGSFNVSTAAAMLAAAAGARVIKHGNRSVTSKCGSADLLEAVGIPLELSPAASLQVLEQVGITFLFAPTYHPAMRHSGPVRRALGLPTIFNLLGPLCNPGLVKRQLLGINDGERVGDFADVLRGLGHERALVVHGGGGADELTLEEGNRIAVVGELRGGGFTAGDLGLTKAHASSAKGGDATANARLLDAIFAGVPGPLADVVLINAAASLVVAGIADSAREGLDRSREAIASGAAKLKVQHWRDVAREVAAKEPATAGEAG